MKLIFCPHCQDVFKLQINEMRYCKCGKSYGQYTDNINAEINKEAIPIGFSNSTFIYALLNRPETGLGKEFCAFVIPNHCESIKIIED